MYLNQRFKVMKRKTINAVISKKMNDWLSSIEDDSLRHDLKKKIIVTGGSITSMLLNEPVNDFDIYLTDKAILIRLAKYYANKWNKIHGKKENKVDGTAEAWVLDGKDVELWKNNHKALSEFAVGYEDMKYSEGMEWTRGSKGGYGVSSMLLNTTEDRVKIIINSDGIAEDSDETADNSEYNVEEYVEAVSDLDEINDDALVNTEDKYKPIFLSTNAITLSNKVQIVIRFYGDPEEIHLNYDFIHTTNYWTFDSGIVLNQKALEAILNKDLFYSGSKYPIASIIRTRKFIKRGWNINAGQYLKMAFQISELDLTDISVLEDQLVGVDSIYFLNFVKLLKEQHVSNKYFKLSNDYVTSVVDKIFG